MVEGISEGIHLVLAISISFADPLCGSAVSKLQWIGIWRFWTPVPGLKLLKPTMSGICGLDGHVILLGSYGPFGNGNAMTGYTWPAMFSQ